MKKYEWRGCTLRWGTGVYGLGFAFELPRLCDDKFFDGEMPRARFLIFKCWLGPVAFHTFHRLTKWKHDNARPE